MNENMAIEIENMEAERNIKYKIISKDDNINDFEYLLEEVTESTTKNPSNATFISGINRIGTNSKT